MLISGGRVWVHGFLPVHAGFGSMVGWSMVDGFFAGSRRFWVDGPRSISDRGDRWNPGLESSFRLPNFRLPTSRRVDGFFFFSPIFLFHVIAGWIVQ